VRSHILENNLRDPDGDGYYYKKKQKNINKQIKNTNKQINIWVIRIKN